MGEDKYIFFSKGVKFVPNHYNDFYNHNQASPITTPEHLIEVLQKRLDEGCEAMSMMVHPAFVDQTLMKLSSYNTIRMIELETLLDDRVKAFMDSHDIELISYKDI